MFVYTDVGSVVNVLSAFCCLVFLQVLDEIVCVTDVHY